MPDSLPTAENGALAQILRAAADQPVESCDPLLVLVEAMLAEHRAQALREAASALGDGVTMRVLVERESCDWWTDRPVARWLRDRADDGAP